MHRVLPPQDISACGTGALGPVDDAIINSEERHERKADRTRCWHGGVVFVCHSVCLSRCIDTDLLRGHQESVHTTRWLPEGMPHR